jgi:hypothetical protein
VLFVLTLPAVTARLYSSDEVQYFAYLRSLWFDRDVSFDNDYRYFYDRGVARTPGFEENFLQRTTPTGRRENFGSLGSALLWSPFYLIADLTTRLLRVTGSELPADGYSRLYIGAVAYGSAIYAFAAILLSILAARRVSGAGLAAPRLTRGSVVAGIAVWFGTPLLFYMYTAPPFAHACSAFAVALFVTVWLRARDGWSMAGLLGLGACAALMTMVREQDAFYVAGPAVDYALTVIRERRFGGTTPLTQRILRPLAGTAMFLAVYSPQLFAYLSLNGRFGPSQLVTRKMTWTAPHALQVLASPEHGLFVWTPLALFAVAGLIVAASRVASGFSRKDASTEGGGHKEDVRRVAGCMLLMLALQVYISGSVESWTVAGAFGQRRFVGATILLVVGLASLWQAAPHGAPRTILAGAMGLAIWWNIGLMALFGAGLMDRQRLNPRQNAYDVFVTLPVQLPQLLYRYVFHRSSFYQTPQ